MSKGHGKVERAILEALKWDRHRNNRGRYCFGTSAATLARYVRGPLGLASTLPTRSEIESVRRALRNLRKQGLVYISKHRDVTYVSPEAVWSAEYANRRRR